MFLPPFFESKKFKIIYAVTMGLLLLMIVSLKIYDSFCEMPGCWNLKDAGTQYCWDHINSIYENSKKKSSGSSNGERIYNSFELFNQSQKYHYTPKRRNTPTPVPRKYNGNSYSSWKSDSYDVSNYDDPDDFADDCADEFGDGDYDGGYDDAYDYWEENGN